MKQEILLGIFHVDSYYKSSRQLSQDLSENTVLPRFYKNAGKMQDKVLSATGLFFYFKVPFETLGKKDNGGLVRDGVKQSAETTSDKTAGHRLLRILCQPQFPGLHVMTGSPDWIDGATMSS